MIAVRTRVASRAHFLCGTCWRIVISPRACLAMSEPIVTVKQGKLRGAVVENVLGSSYIAFKGIPFAAPPIGDLRFKDPQPPKSWTGIMDTSKVIVNPCAQVEEVPPFGVLGDEDCLYLNVYTNSINQSKPVMFWIHGGAFVVGKASFEYTRPDYLIAKDVVVVTVHYRLGAFGFLNLGHRVAPGNLGLKDIIAALEWVKENIANFGGDPENVTVFGVSAGGVLTQYLTLSPRAKGLLHKAIMQSGVTLCSWSTNQSRPERGFKLASLLGKDSTDPVEVVEFLRTVPAEDIVKIQNNILTKEEAMGYDLAFGLNCDEVAENPVLPRPLNDLQEADIPVMIGYTSHEFIIFFKDKSEKAMKAFNDNLPVHVKNLAAVKQLGDREIKKLLEVVKTFYFSGRPICEETIPGFVEFMTDVYFGVPVKVMLENRVKKASTPTYFYRFSYVGHEKAPTDLLVKRLIRGASHVDDVAYLLYLCYAKAKDLKVPAVGSKDRITMERMTTLWSNFAKTGDPTSSKNEFVKTTWKPATASEFNYLEIGDKLESLRMPPHILHGK